MIRVIKMMPVLASIPFLSCSKASGAVHDHLASVFCRARCEICSWYHESLSFMGTTTQEARSISTDDL